MLDGGEDGAIYQLDRQRIIGIGAADYFLLYRNFSRNKSPHFLSKPISFYFSLHHRCGFVLLYWDEAFCIFRTGLIHSSHQNTSEAQCRNV